MKLLYGIDIFKHPKIKNENDVKRIIQHLNEGPNFVINEGESYIIRKTLSDSWVWDKGSRDIVDIFGRLHDNHIVKKLNDNQHNDIHFEVGRNPNKGFLMIQNTLWDIVKIDNSVKGRNLQRLNIPYENLNNIANDLNFEIKKIYNNMFYYVDSFSVAENIQNIVDQCHTNIINFNEEIPFIIFKSKK